MMTAQRPVARIGRRTDVLFDRIGARPIGLVVFALSAAVMLQLIGASGGVLRADAVAVAARVDHPSRVASFVTRVRVRPGDRVGIGAPLVELSPHFIDQRLARLDIQIEELVGESKLAQAKLVVQEERWAEPGLRVRPAAPSLEAPTAAYFAKQLEVEQARRAALLADRDALTIRSGTAGVVSEVAWQGASVAEGQSVASILPEYADEIVAYVAPETDPSAIGLDRVAYILEPSSAACRDPGRVIRRGAAVVQAPEQLKQLFRFPVHGMPVHVSIPAECRLAVGQVLALELRAEASG